MYTQESPIQSWKLMGPAVVSAEKLGAVLPSRRAGMEKMKCTLGQLSTLYFIDDNQINIASSVPTDVMEHAMRTPSRETRFKEHSGGLRNRGIDLVTSLKN